VWGHACAHDHALQLPVVRRHLGGQARRAAQPVHHHSHRHQLQVGSKGSAPLCCSRHARCTRTQPTTSFTHSAPHRPTLPPPPVSPRPPPPLCTTRHRLILENLLKYGWRFNFISYVLSSLAGRGNLPLVLAFPALVCLSLASLGSEKLARAWMAAEQRVCVRARACAFVGGVLRVCMCVCVFVCVGAACVQVCLCVCACVWGGGRGGGSVSVWRRVPLRCELAPASHTLTGAMAVAGPPPPNTHKQQTKAAASKKGDDGNDKARLLAHSRHVAWTEWRVLFLQTLCCSAAFALPWYVIWVTQVGVVRGVCVCVRVCVRLCYRLCLGAAGLCAARSAAAPLALNIHLPKHTHSSTPLPPPPAPRALHTHMPPPPQHHHTHTRTG
jgi:hypothetical protein